MAITSSHGRHEAANTRTLVREKPLLRLVLPGAVAEQTTVGAAAGYGALEGRAGHREATKNHWVCQPFRNLPAAD
jgi:hypothetical protein